MTVDEPEALRLIVELLTRRFAAMGRYAYIVDRQIGDRLDVRPVGSSPQLAQGIMLDKAHGLAGAREVCAPGSLVEVAFRNGDFGTPEVVGFLGALPVSLTLDAETTITLGGVGAGPLARASLTDARIEALRLAINAVATAAMVTLPLASSLATVATTKVRGE